MGVTGPFTKTQSSTALRKTQTWYRQPKPYRAPLEYYMHSTEPLSGNVDGHSWAMSPEEMPGHSSASNKAYNKFLSNTRGDQIMALVNLAERRQTVDMVISRVVSVGRGARALRRGHFGEAASHFMWKGEAPRSVRQTGKAFGDTFLEYHFGWTPLIKDIHRGIELLGSPFPSVLAVGRGSDKSTVFYKTAEPYWGSTLYNSTHRCQIRAEIEVSNRNLFLANQLGVINPLAVAWELIPFSFVVDWFVNVGDYLNSFTDFAGLKLVNPATSTLDVLTREEDAYYGNYRSARSTIFRRTLAVPSVKLIAEVPTRLSPSRGLTAVSLLLQSLGRR